MRAILARSSCFHARASAQKVVWYLKRRTHIPVNELEEDRKITNVYNVYTRMHNIKCHDWNVALLQALAIHLFKKSRICHRDNNTRC